jgi:alpha-acetolactate decarboxylase
MAAKFPNDIFQYSTTGAIQAGYSSHGPVVNHLQNYGSHGIGVFSESDNELIFIDSQEYQITTGKSRDGKNLARKAPSDAGLAFVIVTKFVPEFQLAVNGQLEKDALLDVFSSQGLEAGGKNSFIPFRVRGEFARIKPKAISSARKRGSIRENGAMETKGSDDFSDIKGTIFGFIGPECFAGVSITGVHCCFLSDAAEGNGRYGGSFVDFQTKGEVEVSWAVTGRFHIGFPRGEAWEGLDIAKTSKAG